MLFTDGMKWEGITGHVLENVHKQSTPDLETGHRISFTFLPIVTRLSN